MMIQIPVENSVKHALRGRKESGICGLPQIVGKAVFASGLRITAAIYHPEGAGTEGTGTGVRKSSCNHPDFEYENQAAIDICTLVFG